MPIRTMSLSLLLAVGASGLIAADATAPVVTGASATAPVTSTTAPNHAGTTVTGASATAPVASDTTPVHSPPPPLPGDPRYNRPRFIAVPQDGKLYVFHAGAKELKVFANTHELPHGYERVGVGPDGMTVVAPNADTLEGYVNLYFGSATAAAAAAVSAGGATEPSATATKAAPGLSKSP